MMEEVCWGPGGNVTARLHFAGPNRATCSRSSPASKTRADAAAWGLKKWSSSRKRVAAGCRIVSHRCRAWEISDFNDSSDWLGCRIWEDELDCGRSVNRVWRIASLGCGLA